MPVYRLIKNGQVVNTIVGEQSDLPYYQSIYDVVEEVEQVASVDPYPVVKYISDKFTLEEQVKWNSNANETIVTVKKNIEEGKYTNFESFIPVLDVLVSSGSISEQTKNNILNY